MRTIQLPTLVQGLVDLVGLGTAMDLELGLEMDLELGLGMDRQTLLWHQLGSKHSRRYRTCSCYG